jgi:hypothetical protein
MTANEERRKSWPPPGKMNDAGNISNPIAAIKAVAAKRDRRHVRTPATMYAQLHARANSAARGEVLEVLGQAVQNAAIPARPAARSAAASRMIPNDLASISPTFPEGPLKFEAVGQAYRFIEDRS